MTKPKPDQRMADALSNSDWLTREVSLFGDAPTGAAVAHCAHEEFAVRADVQRLSKEDGGPVTGYSADIQVRCVRCGCAFRFVGLSAGYSPFAPHVSVDGTELRVPMEPAVVTELLGRPDVAGSA